MIENDLHTHEVSVSTELQEDLPQILADHTQLQQVILNLAKNAIEAMASGPTAIKTLRLVTTKDANSVVLLSVQDSGPGNNSRDALGVFDPFFTTKSSGATGLGLSISQRSSRIMAANCGSPRTDSNGYAVPKSLCQV